jgi:hypothetical protein
MRRLFQNRIRFLAAISVIAMGGVLQTTAAQAYCRSEFYRYFKGLGVADARVNPVERVIFSLLLSKTKPDGQPECLPSATAKRY